MLGFGAAGLALIAIYAMLQPVTRVVEATTFFFSLVLRLGAWWLTIHGAAKS